MEKSRNEMSHLGFGILDDLMDDTYLEQCVELIANEIFEPAAIQLSSNFDYGLGYDGILRDISPGGEVENEGDESSGTTTTTTTNPTKRKSKKVDRTRTLTSERKRRSQMKGNLYELRSLVPNITKMDKASIIADAILYIQELQSKSKKLLTDIDSLESSFSQTDESEGQNSHILAKMDVTSKPPPIKNISEIDVIQVDKSEFYGRIICNKGRGIATFLYRALESIELVEVHSSNLTTVAENFILTFTMNVEGLDLASLKVWIGSAFLNQGFDFLTLPSA